MRKTRERRRYLGRRLSRRFSLSFSLSLSIFAESRASRLELRLELTYLPEEGRVLHTLSAGRDRFLRKASGIVSRIKARCRRTRPRSCSPQFPFPLYASDGRSIAQRRGGIEGRKILEHTSLSSRSPSSPSPSALRAPLTLSLTLLSPSDSRFFSSRELAARNQSALLYRAFGRSIPGLLPLSGEVCQEFIESIGDIGETDPVARLGIS